MAREEYDIIAVERRQDVRIIASAPGRYLLASKYDLQGNRREFACRALNMSPRGMLLAAPVIGPVGDRVIAHIDYFGKLEGSIVRVLDRGFVMTINGSDDDRVKLAAKLVWFDRYKNHDVADNRKHERVVPKSPHSRVVLADGSTLSCLVIDMSPSGAAVSADMQPDIGSPIAVGKVIGRVVRRFTEGFAIQFLEPENPLTLEERVIRP